jgi:hypothetical protein
MLPHDIADRVETMIAMTSKKYFIAK